MTKPKSSLDRFLSAQQATFAEAITELRAGKKTGHWIWFIFPQLSSLGTSLNSKKYAIADEREAIEYIAEPTLSLHLLLATKAVHSHVVGDSKLLVDVMGSDLDAQKLVSSLKLFSGLEKSSCMNSTLQLWLDIFDPLALEILKEVAKQGIK